MRFRVSLLLLVVVSLAAPALAQKRSITEKDLFNFVWIGDPQVSPDGSRVAFVRVTVNDKKDGYNTAIWTVATANGETRQLTNGPRDTTPRWSPDGQYLLFVRAPEVSAVASSRHSCSCWRWQVASRFSSRLCRAAQAGRSGRLTAR